MKTIILVRHAQAVTKKAKTKDLERPLTPAGEKSASKVAQRLADKGILPDLIVSSPADRALDTAHIFAELCHYPIQRIEIDPHLYESGDSGYRLGYLRHLPADIAVLMLVGHLPGVHEAAIQLAQSAPDGFPKAGYMRIDFPDLHVWQELQPKGGLVVDFDFPGRRKCELKETQRHIQESIMDSVRHLSPTLSEQGMVMLEKKAVKASQKIAKEIIKRSQKLAPESGQMGLPATENRDASQSPSADEKPAQ